jgi:hypothetical protein
MVKDKPNQYRTVDDAVQSLKLDAARNKVRMIAWLQQDLGIDYKKVSIKSFVHMKHDLCVEIYALLCERVDYNPNTLFTSSRAVAGATCPRPQAPVML